MPTQTIHPPIHSILGDDTARVRRTDPITSHEAADHNDVEKSIGLVLSALRAFGPSADHELIALLGQSGFTPQRLRTARAALVDRGLVEPSGIYRLTAHNRRAIVWSVVDTSDGSAVIERRVLMSDPMPVIKDILGFVDPDPEDDDPDPDEFTPADEMRADAQRYDRRYGE